MSKNYRLTIDSETTGLPIKKGDSYADYKECIYYDTSRIVQLSWICTYGNKIILSRNYIVKIKNIEIKNSHIHGITNQKCETEGIDLQIILDQLNTDLSDTKMIIGYNLEFDLNIIKSEIYRLKIENKLQYGSKSEDDKLVEKLESIQISETDEKEDEKEDLIKKLESIQTFDVMHFALIKYELHKFIKLTELYKKLLQTDFENPHNSLNDVIATFKCFLKMVYDVQLIN